MKRSKLTNLLLAFSLVLGLAMAPLTRLHVQAAEIIATVNGTVLSGTTSNLLLLDTPQGKMEIKLDASTNTDNCKVLLPGKNINVAVTGGNDGYLHAAALAVGVKTSHVSVDTSATATVRGELHKDTKDNLLCLDTAQGKMQIILDDSTSMDGCSVLVIGQKYEIVCARGSDAYMHAVSISDTNASVTTSSGSSPSISNSQYPVVTGKVHEQTRYDVLYLETKDGVMEFKVDSNADTSKGMVHTPGNQLAVAFYHGNDGYLHAVQIAGAKSASSGASIDREHIVTVAGNVGKDSNEDILILFTPQGKMELKLDAVNSVTNCKSLTHEKIIVVNIAYGSDSYFHAIDITGF